MNFGQKCALGSLGLNLLTGVFTFMLGGGQLTYFLPAASISIVRTKYPGIDFSPHPVFYPLMFGTCFALNYAALVYLFILEGKQKIFNTFYYVLWSVHAIALIGWVFTYSFEKLFLMFFLICTYGFSSILIMIIAMIKCESLSDKPGFSTKWFEFLVVNGSASWALYFSSFGCSFFLTSTLMYEDGPSLEVGTLRGFFDQPTTCTIALIPVVVMWSIWIVSDLVWFHHYTRHVHVIHPTFIMVCLGVLSNYSPETDLSFNRQIYLFMLVVSLVAWTLRGRFYVKNQATKID